MITYRLQIQILPTYFVSFMKKKRRKKQIGNNRRRVEVMVCAEKGFNRRNSSIPPIYSPTEKKIKLSTSLEFLDDHGYRPIRILISPLLQ